jgi:hypothetical protein
MKQNRKENPFIISPIVYVEYFGYHNFVFKMKPVQKR